MNGTKQIISIIVIMVTALSVFGGELTDKTVSVAAEELAWDDKSPLGQKLLTFALLVNDDDPGALLLQAKVQRGLKIELPDKRVNRASYVKDLLGIASKTKSQPHKLMLYVVAQMVDPKNETALVELTKAQNDGLDVGFDVLAKAVREAVSKPPVAPVEKITAAAGSRPSLSLRDKIEKHNGHSYMLVKKHTSWENAKKYCEEKGGYLVCISDAKENAFIVELTNGAQTWIGLSDIEEEGNFVWVNGEKSRYRSWYPAQPNGGRAENYVLINCTWAPNGTGMWTDAPMNDSRINVCHLVVEWDN